jgi:hypothetical protein
MSLGGRGARHLLGGCDDLGGPLDEGRARLIHATTLERHAACRSVLRGRGHRGRDRFSDRHRPPEAERLLDIGSPGAGQASAEQFGDHRAATPGEALDVFRGQRADEARGIAHLDLIEEPVLNAVHGAIIGQLECRRAGAVATREAAMPQHDGSRRRPTFRIFGDLAMASTLLDIGWAPP